MGEETLLEKIREWIGGIGWKLFLWGIAMSAEEYLEAIYQQEKELKEQDATKGGKGR